MLQGFQLFQDHLLDLLDPNDYFMNTAIGITIILLQVLLEIQYVQVVLFLLVHPGKIIFNLREPYRGGISQLT